MILLSKCKWLEAMLGAKNTEWTETQTTAQPQCQAPEDPYRILMWERRLRTGRLRSGRSKLLTCWGTGSGFGSPALSFWLERGSAAEANVGLSWKGKPYSCESDRPLPIPFNGWQKLCYSSEWSMF